jgi:AraC-like DNA-binding protein
LYDYLFTTAATLREGMAAAREFLHLVTTNGRLEIHPDAERDSAYTYRQVDPGGRGGELCSQFTTALWCVRARAATGRHVAPAQVAVPTAAPRSRHSFVEAFGTHRVDFGAPVSSITFRAADLGMPMTGADPRLAGILRRYAASLPPPQAVTFPEVFRVVLTEALERGAPSLHEVAARLTVSPRTLQRRLAEHGTTWRAELDAARRHAASSASAQPVKMASLAHRLGYSDPRSARRALRRWAEATP